MSRTRLLAASGGLLMAIVVVVTATWVLAPSDPSSPYFPTRKVAGMPFNMSQSSTGTAGAATQLHLPNGPIARPNSKLTPGAISIHDLATLCRQPKHTKGIFAPLDPLIPLAYQQAVFAAYKIPAASQRKYGLDLLIPIQLGGAITAPNIWPVPIARGLGFHDKEVLNVRMHVLVCHGEMTLAQAQRLMAADWVTLWLRYGARP